MQVSTVQMKATTLTSFEDYRLRLTQLPCNLSLDDIAKIAAKDGGTRALEAVINYGLALMQVGISVSDIVKIAANDGGAQGLQAVITLRPVLAQLGFSTADVVKIAANDGGAQSPQGVIIHNSELTQMGFSTIEIVKIKQWRRASVARGHRSLFDTHASRL